MRMSKIHNISPNKIKEICEYFSKTSLEETIKHLSNEEDSNKISNRYKDKYLIEYLHVGYNLALHSVELVNVNVWNKIKEYIAIRTSRDISFNYNILGCIDREIYLRTSIRRVYKNPNSINKILDDNVYSNMNFSNKFIQAIYDYEYENSTFFQCKECNCRYIRFEDEFNTNKGSGVLCGFCRNCAIEICDKKKYCKDCIINTNARICNACNKETICFNEFDDTCEDCSSYKYSI